MTSAPLQTAIDDAIDVQRRMGAEIERLRAALRDVRRVVVGEHSASWVSQDGVRIGRQMITEICDAALASEARDGK